MDNPRRIKLLYGRTGIEVQVPEHATLLHGDHGKVLQNPGESIRRALENPIGSPGLSELLRKKKPRNAVITISDITRPVPNTVILPEILSTLNANGVTDDNITIVVGTGMHRPSTDAEKIELVGNDLRAVERLTVGPVDADVQRILIDRVRVPEMGRLDCCSDLQSARTVLPGHRDPYLRTVQRQRAWTRYRHSVGHVYDLEMR